MSKAQGLVRLLPLLAAFVLVPGGVAQPAVEAAEAQVFATERAFAKTMADRDLEAFGTFISDEAIFFSGDPPLRGREAVVAGWKRFFEGAAPFSWEPDQVVVLESGTLALSTGIVRDPTGVSVSRFDTIWRLEEDGAWRVIFDKGSPLPDAAP
jgi:ketosteroid isomerase-like protein